MTVEESFRQFCKANHLDERWMGVAIASKRLKLWPRLLIPKSLWDWLKVHDAHHLIIGYNTDFAGEAEIATWALPRNGLNFEAGSRVIPLLTAVDSIIPTLVGLILIPKRIIRAWRRGKEEYSLRNLNSGLVLEMKFDQAKHSVVTGEAPIEWTQGVTKIKGRASRSADRSGNS